MTVAFTPPQRTDFVVDWQIPVTPDDEAEPFRMLDLTGLERLERRREQVPAAPVALAAHGDPGR